MRRWFLGLSIHKKLVAMALMIAAVAVLVAMTGLVLVDLIRFRSDASTETEALARVVAENVASAIRFDEVQAALDTLATVRSRTMISSACIYLPDGRLYAGGARDGTPACAAQAGATGEHADYGWRQVWVREPIPHEGGVVGYVVIERDLADLRQRVLVTVAVGTGMLLLSSVLALLLAHRLHRSISGPIADLARAARIIGHDDSFVMPPLAVPPDEVGDLVRSFSEMVRRVSHASATLTETNAVLRREIEERRRMEAEREDLLERERRSSRLKDEFLATVSHELRTPLNAILGWSQILRNGEPAPGVLTRAVASIDRNARAQTRLIEDLIDISRIVTGQLQLKVALVDLRPLVDAALEVVRPTAHVKDVSLHMDLAPSPCVVLGDGQRLQQILWNVLSNAVKFTPPGGSVHVSLAAEGDAWSVRVQDTGVGIDEAFVPHIFERFRMADASMTREHGGLGLGLAIARDLTQLHGGAISAESDGVGLGASFTVRLPARLGVPGSEASHDDGHHQLPSLDGVHVLLVDDSVDTLDVLGTTLMAVGADVDIAVSGDEALAVWHARRRDVLLCDLAMPHMDGYELLRRVRAIDAVSGRLTPAIAVTAHASPDERTRSLGAGFQQHLAKPCHPPDVIRAVAAAVQRS